MGWNHQLVNRFMYVTYESMNVPFAAQNYSNNNMRGMCFLDIVTITCCSCFLEDWSMMVFCDAFTGDLIGNPVANFRSTILYALGDVHCWLVATNLYKSNKNLLDRKRVPKKSLIWWSWGIVCVVHCPFKAWEFLMTDCLEITSDQYRDTVDARNPANHLGFIKLLK